MCSEGVGHVLNFRPNVAGSLLVLGSIFVSIIMPLARAFGGIRERKRRAGFARMEKGLNLTRTSVRNRVIMLQSKGGVEDRWRRLYVL